MTIESELDLTVQVNAAEWAYNQRRTTYLEVLLLRLVREEIDLVEWYSADELAALSLPGLPPTAVGIARRAAAGKWRRRRDRRGHKFHYHVATLPARAFDALIGRLLDLPEIERDELAPLDGPVSRMPSVQVAGNTAPPWVLPLMRLMKGTAAGDLGTAWRDLPAAILPGIVLPSVEEAAMVLVALGLADGK